jgi:hypothetical protein
MQSLLHDKAVIVQCDDEAGGCAELLTGTVAVVIRGICAAVEGDCG